VFPCRLHVCWAAVSATVYLVPAVTVNSVRPVLAQYTTVSRGYLSTQAKELQSVIQSPERS
jgi:hypothetical protein